MDGVPIVGKDKLEKLLAKICKEFSKKGVVIKSDDIHVPWDNSTSKNKGYVARSAFSNQYSHPHQQHSFLFIEFRNVDEANLALVSLHNHPFDTRHVFKLNRFADIEKYANLDESYVEPEAEDFVPKVHLYLESPSC